MANYVTLIEANSYVSSYKLSSAEWDALDDDEKGVLISVATRSIDRLAYKNTKVSEDQENEFPRGNDTEIPTAIKDACVELAFTFATGRDVESEYDSIGVVNRKFGPVSITLKPELMNRTHVVAGIPSIEAWQMLTPYLRNIDQITVEKV